MPTLNWIGKEAVENHHNEVPFRLLKRNNKLSVGEADSGNLLVQGDNLEALKALLPYYAGQVKCIYIDPPYNTGKENWVYNDNVNSPEMKDWLGKVVGKKGDDLSRSDKWLCMMYPRLALLKHFLSQDGIIFVSIDDNELQSLRILMDDFFGFNNLVACFIWQTDGNFDNQAKVKIAHEYILAYAYDYSLFPTPPVIDPNIPQSSKLFRDEIINTIVKNGLRNPVSSIVLPKGFPVNFKEGIIKKREDSWPTYSNDVQVKDFKTVDEVTVASGWSSKRIFENFIESNFQRVLDTKKQQTSFWITHTGAIESVKERATDQSHVISVIRNVGTTQSMSMELKRMGVNFDYPKPVGLIKYLISMVQGNDFLVLDSFAGSGTTAHSVLDLNKMDGGNRRAIIVEMDKDICKNITFKRLKSAISGYSSNQKDNHIDISGLGGGFSFCELGQTLFDAEGQIRDEVSYNELARHIYFCETGEPLPKTTRDKSPLLGIHKGVAIYLLYNGILKDKKVNGGNVLTSRILAELPEYDGKKVIYGTACRFSEKRLRSENIVFKQTPYEIRIS